MYFSERTNGTLKYFTQFFCVHEIVLQLDDFFVFYKIKGNKKLIPTIMNSNNIGKCFSSVYNAYLSNM